MGGGIRVVSTAERRARLAVRHHLAPVARARTVAAAAEGVLALHGTDPASVYLAAWARTAPVAPVAPVGPYDPDSSGPGGKAAVEDALYANQSLVRMLGMRRTVFVVPAALVPVIQAACTDQVAERLRRQLTGVVQAAGIAPDAGAWLRDVSESTLRVLSVRGSATGAELS